MQKVIISYLMDNVDFILYCKRSEFYGWFKCGFCTFTLLGVHFYPNCVKFHTLSFFYSRCYSTHYSHILPNISVKFICLWLCYIWWLTLMTLFVNHGLLFQIILRNIPKCVIIISYTNLTIFFLNIFLFILWSSLVTILKKIISWGDKKKLYQINFLFSNVLNGQIEWTLTCLWTFVICHKSCNHPFHIWNVLVEYYLKSSFLQNDSTNAYMEFRKDD
jgi:hypothetical protein